jgi:serine/threonine protein kinase/DNA-binding SARP family transcriptional activator
VRISVLGDIRADAGGGPALISNQRQQRILVALVLAGDAGLGVETLVTRVWEEAEEPTDAIRSLRTYVNRLRNTIGEQGSVVVATRPGGYALAMQPDDLDATVFERIVTGAAYELDPYVALELYDEALALWSGPAYRDLSHLDWVRPEAVRLDELRLSAEEARLRIRLDADRHTDVAADAARLILSNPHREQLTAIRATALYRSGRQVEALEELEQHRSRMREDLGVEPSPELQELEVRILNQDPDLLASYTGGRRLRGFRLGNRIGEGAHSIVYRATQPSVGREVAIKVIRKDLANEKDFIRRFEAEAQLVARLQHPHVVPLYDFWREADGAYLVMPWLQGGSLARQLRAGPLSLEETVGAVHHVAAGLDFAHGRGVIHRDVKPSNVLLDSEGNAYISDFGIALTEISVGDAEPLPLSVRSPAYAAPEQFGGGSIGPGVDIYALAVMTYELLAGSLPWPESATTATLLHHHRKGLPPIELADNTAAHAVNAILARATATDPAERFASSAEFAEELAGTVSARPARTEVEPSVNPYRGLAAFEEPDAPFFFGRAELVAAILDKLDREPVTLLVGPSGSGKSSVLRAGVIPVLRSGGSLPVVVTPTSDPMGSLASAIESISTTASGAIRSDLDAGESPAAVIERVAPGSRVVIAIDQLEELFTLARAEDAEAFLAALAASVTAKDSSLKVIASIRADFFAYPVASPSFGTISGPATVTIGPMRAEQIAAAISEPARLSGVEVEPALIAELTADAAGRPGSLPLMQFALTRAWDERSGSTLTLEDYERLGGLTGTLVRSAETVWASLGASERDAARRLLSRLVHVGDEVTRRREEFGAAVSLSGVEPGLIEMFADARLVTLDRDQTTREPTIELSHEALIEAWPRLANWVEESGTALVTAQRLRADASEWDAAGRDPDLLYSGGRLAAAQDAAADPAVAIAPREQAFLEASAQAAADADEAARQGLIEQERQRRRRRTLLVLTSVVGVVGILAVVLAVFASRRATDESRAADFTQLISRSIDAQTTQTDLALLLAAEAYAQNPGIESQRALLGALQNVEGTVEVWEAPRFPHTSFGGCFNIVRPGQIVTQPNTFSNDSPDPGGRIVDIDLVDRTVHRIESSRLECDVQRSPRSRSDESLYVGSDDSPTTIVVDANGTEIGSYPGFVEPFFDARGRLLVKSGDPDGVGAYVELDPRTGDVLSETLFEAEEAVATAGGRFLSVIFERMNGPVPDPSGLLDPDTYDMVVDLSTETGRAIQAATSADDSRFGYVSRDERLLVWDTVSGLPVIDVPVAETAQAIAFSPDGSRIALLVDEGGLQIRSGANGQLRRTIDIGREPVMTIDWTHEDHIAVLRTIGVVDFIATGGGGLYETGPACCARNEIGFMVPEGIPNPYAGYADRDTGINRYVDVVTGEERQVDISPWASDGSTDFWVTVDKTTVVIRPPFELIRVGLDGTTDEPRYPFGDGFVLQEETPDRIPNDLHGGDELMFLKLTEGSVSPGFRDAVLEELQIGVIDVDTMEVVVEPNLVDLGDETPTVDGAELHPGGMLLVRQTLDDGRMRLQYFNAEGRRLLEFVLPFDNGWWTLTPDRRYLLTANALNDEVRRWDVETGESIVLPVFSEPQVPVMLSGGRFLIQTRSGQFELWDIEAGTAIGRLADVGPLAFTFPTVHPDESHVWIVLDGAWTKIPLDPLRWFELACELAGRSLTEAEWRELVSSDLPYRDACADAA